LSSAPRWASDEAAGSRAGLHGGVVRSYAAFSAWLTTHPLAEDRAFGASSVRYQVARYCDYLEANPWTDGDPLRNPAAREGAVKAYGVYLSTFHTSVESIRLIRLSVDHFYVFLGLPTAESPDISTI
jgi:hypothetical protein